MLGNLGLFNQELRALMVRHGVTGSWDCVAASLDVAEIVLTRRMLVPVNLDNDSRHPDTVRLETIVQAQQQFQRFDFPDLQKLHKADGGMDLDGLRKFLDCLQEVLK